jgi:sucrose-6-phosphate hydrolase SacC (GH32 family)
VLVYTAAGNPAVQCLASSTDGRTYAKFGGNPVVKQIAGGNRDPKVYWHAPTGKWVMALYVGLPGQVDKRGRPLGEHTIHFLTSPNLKDWTVTSRVEGFHECPDYFALPVDGDARNTKWVLTAADSDYMLGGFDGAKFTPETAKLKGHRGRGFYAAQTFAGIPAADGRRIQIGWLQAPSPGMPFNQAMSIPLELSLRTTPEGPRLAWQPVKELGSLRRRTQTVEARTLKPGDANPLAPFSAELVELRAEFQPGPGSQVLFSLRGVPVCYDAKRQEIVVSGQRAAAPLRDGRQRIIIFLDRTAIEVFASDGLAYVPCPVIPRADNLSLAAAVSNGEAKLLSLTAYELNSAWPPARKER